MPRKEIISPTEFGEAMAPLSPAIKVGNTVWVSGQVGRNYQTGEMPKDIESQTRNCMERIKLCLEQAGTSIDNVVSATCWITDTKDFAAFNRVYASYFPGDKPARATVQSNLVAPGGLVEVMVTAVLPE